MYAHKGFTKAVLLMTQVMVELPDILANLPVIEREALIQAGLHEAVRVRAREVAAEIAEATAQVQRFEERYGMSFERFEEQLLPALDSLQTHQDYNDWFFWQCVLREQQALLASLQS